MTKIEKLTKKNVKRVTSVLLKLLESNPDGFKFILPSVRKIQMELMNEFHTKKTLPYRRRMSSNSVKETAHLIYSNMGEVSAEHWERKRGMV